MSAMRFLIYLVWISILPALVFADVPIQVEPSVVPVGESFHLIITIDNPPDDTAPDLAPLQQQFRVVGTERSLSYRSINGQIQSSSQWVILLMAHKEGTFTIPSFQIGALRTMPSQIKVTSGLASPGTRASAQPDALMLKTEANPKSVLVNQQLLYTVKLYSNERLLDADYEPPQVENALLIPLGEGRRYQEIVNSTNYLVEEQRYAIFPQRSGSLKIISPSFSALAYGEMPERVNLRAKTKHIEVKPIPSGHTDQEWLPAKQLQLSESYDEDQSLLVEGSTLVREVEVRVTGFPSQLLPNLNFSEDPAFSLYADKPTLTNLANFTDIIGHAKYKVTYLFNKAGEVTLPRLALPWFNITTQQWEVAALPAKKIRVQPKTGALSNAPSATSITVPAKPHQRPAQLGAKKRSSSHVAAWLAVGLGMAWIFTLALWWFFSKRNSGKTNLQPGAALPALRRACLKNDAKAVEKAILDWARVKWPQENILNLQQVHKLVHLRTLKKELSHLIECLFSAKHKKWSNGQQLWTSLKSYQAKPSVKPANDDLPPINKHR